MKKILVVLLLSFIFSSLSFADNIVVSTWNLENSTWKILEVTSATSGTQNVLKEEKSIEETMITYYYSSTCSYCQRLNRYLDKVDGYSKLNIDKREVSNKDNSRKWTEDIKRLWLENDKSIWVPFLVVNENWKESVLRWLDEAMAYFEPKLGKVIETKVEVDNNKNVKIFMLIVVLLAIFIPFLFIKKSK